MKELKEKLEQFKDLEKKLKEFNELHDFFEERVEEIGILKNTDPNYDFCTVEYDGEEWTVEFVKKSYCGCCSDDTWWVNVSNDEILSDYDEIVEKLKREKEEKEKAAERKKIAEEKARKEAAEKAEKEEFLRLKKKYETKK